MSMLSRLGQLMKKGNELGQPEINPRPPLFGRLQMSLGDPTTLIVSLAALCLAAIATGEATFIGYHTYGHVRGPDTWQTLVFVAVMLVVRRKWFSYIVLIGYFYLSLQFARVIYFGNVRNPVNFEAEEGLFFILSLLSVVFFSLNALLRWLDGSR
jgi:hypothetical protein